jgi:RNA-directed DNA polymerase
MAKAPFADGYCWNVDLDLKKFFDRVNQNFLMSSLALSKTSRCYGLFVAPCKRVFLKVGLSRSGRKEPRRYRYCRFADNCNIYLRAKGNAVRILISVTQCVEEQLKLEVIRSKSAVDRPWNHSFLGDNMTFHKKPR